MRRSGDEVGHAPENAGSGGDNAPAAEDLAPATDDPASPQQEAAVGRCAWIGRMVFDAHADSALVNNAHVLMTYICPCYPHVAQRRRSRRRIREL